MVLNEVDYVVVELLHVSELGHKHGVASPQPFIVLRERSDGTVVAGSVHNRRGSSWGSEWRRVTPIGLLVRVIWRRDADSA